MKCSGLECSFQQKNGATVMAMEKFNDVTYVCVCAVGSVVVAGLWNADRNT